MAGLAMLPTLDAWVRDLIAHICGVVNNGVQRGGRLIVVSTGYFLVKVHIGIGKSSVSDDDLGRLVLCELRHTHTASDLTSMAQLCARAISDLATAYTPHEQITAAKHIKNALVGHPTNKEAFVRHGLVDTLVQLLSTYPRDGTKQRHGTNLFEEEEVIIEALVLLRSIVKGPT